MRTHKIVTFVLGFTSLQANVVSALPSDGSGAWTRSLPGGSGTQALEDRDAATDISLRSDVTSLDSLELASDLERRSYKDLVDWWGQVSTIPTMALWCLGLTYGAHKVVLKYTTEVSTAISSAARAPQLMLFTGTAYRRIRVHRRGSAPGRLHQNA